MILTCSGWCIAAQPRPRRTAAPYAFDKPLTAPRIFAEGVISTSDDEFGGTFTPDGRDFYFTKRSPATTSRPLFVICVSHFRNGSWGTPEVASFSGLYPDFSPTISPDGSKLFFTSFRSADGKIKGDTDIWFVKKTANGWSRPENPGAPVNSDASEQNSSVTADGTLYFSSTRSSGKGSFDIYRSRFIDGKYAEPENVGDAINTDAAEAHPYVSPDEGFLIFTSIGRPEINLSGGFPYARGDLYISYRKNGVWSRAVNLGPKINSIAAESNPSVSPDGKYLFFTSERGFVNIPMPRRLTMREFERKLHSTLNNSGNIYQIDLNELGFPK